jgi:hypothetical protein
MPHKLARYALYGLFGSWFAVSVMGQDPFRREDRVRKWDKLSLVVPVWRFFAPNPGIHDYHLLCRDELASGEVTEWKEVCTVEARTPRHIFWHPHRRSEKVLFDITAEVLRFIGETTDLDAPRANRDLQFSVPYITLLNYVSGQHPHQPDAERTQFLLAASAGYDENEEPTMLFLSEFHPLDDSRDADVLAEARRISA